MFQLKDFTQSDKNEATTEEVERVYDLLKRMYEKEDCKLAITHTHTHGHTQNWITTFFTFYLISCTQFFLLKGARFKKNSLSDLLFSWEANKCFTELCALQMFGCLLYTYMYSVHFSFCLPNKFLKHFMKKLRIK